MEDIIFENDMISCVRKGDIAIIHLLSNTPKILSDLSGKGEYLTMLEAIERDDSLFGTITINAHTLYDDNTFAQMWKDIFGPDGTAEASRIRAETIFNAVHQIARVRLRHGKPMIIGMTGDVGYEFMGVSLASDFRIAATNTTFHNTTIKYGLPNLGLMPFFLPRYVGTGRSLELLACPTLPAMAARELGLVTAVVNESEVLSVCLAKMQELKTIPPNVLSMIRHDVHPSANELDQHLEHTRNNRIKMLINSLNTNI